jgi:alpha-glucosidase
MSADSFLERVGLRGEPLAAPEVTVIHGECRFTALTARLIRIEWAPGGLFDDRSTYAFPSRRGPASPFHLAVSGDELTLTTGALRLQRRGRSGQHTADNLSVELDLPAGTVVWTPGSSDPQNLRGARRTLDVCRGEAALEPGLLSRAGWALYDDSAAVRFDPVTGWVQPAAAPLQDWYLFGYGHDYKQAFAEYGRFGGAVPLIPRWALGAWWSRYWPYSEQEIRRLIAEFAEHDFPLDVFVIDMDWHLPGWTGYTWNPTLFPDPQVALAWIHRQGLRTTLNLHPADGVGPHEAAYPAFAAALGVPQGEAVPFHISDPAFVQAYFELLHHPLEDQGVDFWWMDWQQGRSSEIPGLDPLPWLNHLHFQDMRRRPGRRPLVFSRWGGLGNHRYPIGFSGDTYATWEALRFQPYFTATAANVLYGWWSHDVGGHFDVCEPELYARWVQLGAFSPILRLHSTNDPAAERRPWAFPPTVRDVARAAFKARYALLPYLYTLTRLHTDEGLAPARPLYYEWPEAEAAYTAREQYALGEQLIVAPILRPAYANGLAHADVWVPPGDWIERATGELLRGPAWVRLVGDLQTIPQLVRAGAILPLAPERSRSHQQPADQLILSIFPGQSGMFRLYEDAGEGEEYHAGQYEWTPITLRSLRDDLRREVTIGPVEGRCHALPEQRAYTLRFEFSRPPAVLLLNGEEHRAWSYDEQERAIVLNIPPRPKELPLQLVIEGSEPLALVGAAQNSVLCLADARRLLALPDVGPEQLLNAALAGTSPAHRTARARLGGPFAVVYEYTTPEDAVRTLGALVVAAPRDGSSVRVGGLWRLFGPDGVTEQPFDLGALANDMILHAPFAWDGQRLTRRWTLELSLGWRDHELRERFQSQPHFPTVGSWRILVAPTSRAYALSTLLDASGAPQPALPWETHFHTPAHGEFQSLVERYGPPLKEYAHPRGGSSVIGYCAATLRSPDARELRVAYQSPAPSRVYLNGRELPTEQFVEASFLCNNPDWSYTSAAALQPGLNHLLIVNEHDGEHEPWRWFLNVQLLDAAGEPLPEVVVLPPEPVLQ